MAPLLLLLLFLVLDLLASLEDGLTRTRKSKREKKSPVYRDPTRLQAPPFSFTFAPKAQ